MTRVVGAGEYYAPISPGPALQYSVPARIHGLVGPVSASGSISSNVIETDGWPKAAIGLTSSQSGTLSVQRCIDPAGTVAQGAPLTAALGAGAPAVVNISDGRPFASMVVSVTNTGGSSATLSSVAILLSA